jgi:thioesterase domain-containing protein
MATHYIEALRGVQREGPYLLCGWSLGGVVAFEMAQQLRRQGNAVALLALIDSRAPDPRLLDIASDDATLLINLARDIGLEIAMDDLRELGPEEQLNYFLGRGQKDQIIPIDFDLLQISRLFNVYKTNVRAWRNYKPEVYASRILLFRASEMAEKLDSSDLPDDPTLGWGRFSLEPVEVRAVPGNHTSMIAEPNVQFLADELKRCISKAHETNATWA